MFVLPEGIEPSPYHRKWHVLTSSLWQHLQIFSFILNPFESFLRMVCDQNVYLDYIQLGVIGATLFLFIHTVLASLLWDIVSGLVWYRLESNQWHPDFQSGALPTELRYLVSFWLCKGMNYFFNIQIFYKVFFIFFSCIFQRTFSCGEKGCRTLISGFSDQRIDHLCYLTSLLQKKVWLFTVRLSINLSLIFTLTYDMSWPSVGAILLGSKKCEIKYVS